MNKLSYLFKSLCFLTLLFVAGACDSEEEEVKALEEHTVTFNSGGGTPIIPKRVEANTKVTKPSVDPVKEAYVFVEWQLGGKKYDFNTLVTGDITLTAIYAISYTVTFNSNGGTAIASIKVGGNTKVTKPSTNPVKKDSVFVEWRLGGKKYDFNTLVTGDITLTAIYAIPYTVAFDSKGGSAIASVKVGANTKLTKPSNPTKKDSLFVEWQLRGRKYDFNTLVTGDITLTAVWDSMNQWETVAVGSGVKLTRYLGKAKEVVVPKSVRGKEVLEIGSYIFDQSKSRNTSITGVDMSRATSLRTIGDMAFKECARLTNITLPSGLTTIGESAFFACVSLKGFTFPNSLTTIGDGAFRYCNKLNNITLPSSITTIGTRTFVYCTSLTNITLPSTLTTIEDGAFLYCTSLTNITLPSSLTTIEHSAFANSGLTSITLPSSITTIGMSAFFRCADLTSITFSTSSNLTTIGDLVFASSGLTSITLPNSITTIGGSSFKDCADLRSITLPSGLKTIADYVFQNCTSLSSITFPSTLTNTGGYVFDNCTSLTSVTFPTNSRLTTISEYSFLNCTSLNTITLPNSVTTIRGEAFWGCRALTSITLSSRLTSIGEAAFKDCTGLTSITLPSALTTIGGHVFDNCRVLTLVTLERSASPLTTIEGSTFKNTPLTSTTTATIRNPSEAKYCEEPIWKDLKATFENCAGRILEEYTVTFNSNGGTAIDQIEVKENKKLSKPSVDPVKEGHVFVEWQLGGAKYNFNTSAVTGDITLTALWSFVEWQTVELNTGGIKLVRYLGEATEIVIPESVRGKYVKVIGSNIFGQSWKSKETSITSVDMSKATKLMALAWDAFSYCQVLTSITLPNADLTTIGSYAFAYCTSLTSITIPSNITTIVNSAFVYCSKLTLVTLERSASPLTTIEGSTFNKTPLTSTTEAAIIKHPSGASYKTADVWKALQATFEVK